MLETASGNTMRVAGLPILTAAGALLLGACAGGGMAPVVERSTTGSGSSQAERATGGSAANAASEAVEGDWTATVRPLGDSGSTASRPLPSETPAAVAAPTTAGEAAPDSMPAAQPAAPAPGAATPAQANPAVVSLLNTASAQSRAGDHARAAATLERAIAIEPDNAWLWHRLAATRIKEGRLDQGVELAAKSNSLANAPSAADRSLQAENWKLIAEVRRRQGDAGGAAAAESRAAALSN
jgi:tetratricopeptide (TPR) repeat protein